MPSKGVVASKNKTALRGEIDTLIAAGSTEAASQKLAELWRQERGPATAGYVVSRYENLRPHLPLVPYRLAILRSFTVEPLIPSLRALAFMAGIDLQVHLGDFNSYFQEVLDPDSAFYQFSPQAVILSTQTRDIAPELWRDYAGLTSENIRQVVNRVSEFFRNWVEAVRKHSHSHIIIHGIEAPVTASLGILDSQSENSQSAVIQEINHDLRRMARDHTGVHILDYDALVARYGRDQWHDERKWLTVRSPVAANNLTRLAEEWLRFLHPLTGKVAKALVVDLDNTLWGGVIGEDGMDGISLSAEYPGAAYQELQRAMLDLSEKGILLAICSKNNPEEALEVLNDHPGMLLRLKHFAAVRINWNDKVDNLRGISAELNLGIDSLAFLDDNPIERQQIRTELPEVSVLDLPDDPMKYAQALRDCPLFERLVLSTEDRQRSEQYVFQRQRLELERGLNSREDFYRSLGQKAEITDVSARSLVRVAQLIQKTNQFNLTTRRYTEQQIAEMIASEDWNVYCLRVQDRFSDNGIVGAAIIHTSGDTWEIDTFVLSCRVIGRTVETGFISFIVDQARRQSVRRVEGWFLPTKKNAPAQSFYPAHGFETSRRDGDGSLWSLDLEHGRIACPEWISLRFGDEGSK